MDSTPFLEPALLIVRQAGDYVRDMHAQRQIRSLKPNDDLVTDGDLQAEAIILEFIKHNFPEHGYDSEEAGLYNPGADFTWILDPVDGTKYYARLLPLYAVSLALYYRTQPVLGVVYLPETGQLFHAAGRGAMLNGAGIRCSAGCELQEALVCLEMPSRHSAQLRRDWAFRQLGRLLNHSQRIRIIGVGSIGLCFCAMGGFDVYLNLADTWKRCDVAAGQVIMEQAAGVYLEQDRTIIAGPGKLVEELRGFLFTERREE